MKLELFEAENFYAYCKEKSFNEYGLAQLCNKILSDYLETLPVVYGFTNKNNKKCFAEITDERDTHQARLICVEEIQKKECDHELESMKFNISNKDHFISIPLDSGKCKKCGKKLKAKWEVCP